MRRISARSSTGWRLHNMTEVFFSLIPFDPTSSPAIIITGRIEHLYNRLALYYTLYGDLNNILLPAPAARPGRRQELWKATCFEFFLARKDQPSYWEFNLSPSGDWNVYRMDAYRRTGFREEGRISQLQLETQTEKDAFSLATAVDLGPMLSTAVDLEVSITAIIQTAGGTETYWALTHAGPQADFHLRQSFILELAGQTHLSNRPDPVG